MNGQMKNPNLQPEGLWEVSRDNGETSDRLGIWEGRIDTIALHLADQMAYGLRFAPVNIRKPGAPTGDKVDVNLDDVLGWKQTGDETLAVAQQFFINTPAKVVRGKYKTVAFTIESQEALDLALRKEALALLSPAHRKVLGLPNDVSALPVP